MKMLILWDPCVVIIIIVMGPEIVARRVASLSSEIAFLRETLFECTLR